MYPFSPQAKPVLERRYLARDAEGRPTETPRGMLRRVARAVARAELNWGGEPQGAETAKVFEEFLLSGLFLPNSPTLMNAGRPLGQLSACFVLPVEDSLDSIFRAVKHTAIIHQSGGGTGFSFSRLRPAGDVVASTGGVSSGPVSFIKVFDAATEAIKQGGTRRGANMAILGVSHPDIELFIRAKTAANGFHNFNFSVMIPDGFMARVRAGGGWDLINPRTGQKVDTVSAPKLFAGMVRAAHASGEPGAAFFDAMNRANPTPELGALEATNPCGEQPLLPYESCNLGALVLPGFIRNGALDLPALEDAAALAIRFLDDALEVNRFPLAEVKKATRLTRKVGLGVMGFADLLLDLGIPYASKRAVSLGREVMAAIQNSAKEASRELARKRGSFPAFDGSLARREGRKAMRNATVTTVAPTGTLSLLLGRSSGIEPLFALAYTRRMLEREEIFELNPRVAARLKELGLDTASNLEAVRRTGRASSLTNLPERDRKLFATSHEIAPEAHLAVQAAFQAHTDNAVSKTVNLPASAKEEDVRRVFVLAHESGLKGVTVFRDGCRGRQVLELLPLPGGEPSGAGEGGLCCPRCGGDLATDGGCRTCALCGASSCE